MKTTYYAVIRKSLKGVESIYCITEDRFEAFHALCLLNDAAGFAMRYGRPDWFHETYEIRKLEYSETHGLPQTMCEWMQYGFISEWRVHEDINGIMSAHLIRGPVATTHHAYDDCVSARGGIVITEKSSKVAAKLVLVWDNSHDREVSKQRSKKIAKALYDTHRSNEKFLDEYIENDIISTCELINEED